jgi:hypothetical protein
MAKRSTKKKQPVETDSTYILKLALYFIFGTFWVRLLNVKFGSFHDVNIPVGLVLGIIFASHDHFQIDRKIEYAVLLAATFISFYLPVGIVLR